uniref:SSXT domain-containing protein n=1 Tax=Mesocestoides corti TaxID=53468 RepID=A0A5K3FN71_MESCO
MYYPPAAAQSRREPIVTTSGIQKILDDNVQLIHNIMTHQKAGNNNREMQELQVLHKNLIYLATIADQATNTGGGTVAQRGPPPTPLPPQGTHPPPSGFPPGPPEQSAPPHAPSGAVYPPASMSQPQAQLQTHPPRGPALQMPPGQPMPPNYMPPGPHQPLVGGPMPPQHQHALPPQQVPGAPPTSADDRIFLQQRPGPFPPYAYPLHPPPGVQQPQPPMAMQQQHQQFPPAVVSSTGDFGPPRYEPGPQAVQLPMQQSPMSIADPTMAVEAPSGDPAPPKPNDQHVGMMAPAPEQPPPTQGPTTTC